MSNQQSIMQNLNKKILYTTIIALVIVAAVLLCIFSFAEHNTTSNKETFETYAAQILAECEDASYRPTCYEEEVPKLLGTFSLEDTFEVVRQLQKEDESYRFCHVLAHELGEREVAKDPSRWFDIIPRCPQDGLCSNGCVHGAAVERFSQEVLNDEQITSIIPDLDHACEPRDGFNPTLLDQAICYHGIGHMAMHITKADIPKSLDICDQIVYKEDGRNFERVCDEGVFMQIFQPLEPEDYALVEALPMIPTADNLNEFCNYYDKNERAACWREGWPLIEDSTRSSEGIVRFCSNTADAIEERICYDTALSVMARHSLDTPGRAHTICGGLPEERQGQCYRISAVAIIEEDRTRGVEAVEFCEAISEEDPQNACYEGLVNAINFVFHAESENQQNVCDALPNPWNERCLERSNINS